MPVLFDYKLLLPLATPEKRALVESLLNPETLPPQRFKAGYRLNSLGDPRPGVGLRPDGLPQIEWVEVPGGEFVYQAGESYHALPTFYIARYPVTVAQYGAFIADGGYQNPRYWTKEGWAWHSTRSANQPMLWKSPKWHLGNHPVVGMTWYEACAFALWLAIKLGYNADIIRLPTEHEWEKAARGVTGLLYPWGNTCASGDANINETYAYHHVGDFFLKRTVAVGAFARDVSPYGVMDMSGNVREWTFNDYHQIGHVVRGGGWFSNRHQAQSIFRNWFYDRNGDHSIGFRLAAVINPTNHFLDYAVY